MKSAIILPVLLGIMFASPPALAQRQPVCEPTAETHAVRILGEGPAGDLTDQEFPQVYGDRDFYRTLENGWVFALKRRENGWSVRLYEHAPIGNAVDLTSLTPPHGNTPNPRDIFGWHFRNAANTGPNVGDVNAPQNLRAFIISPALQGTGGFRPSTNPNTSRHAPPNPDDGIGWLNVIDYGLSGNSLKAGQQARMNYLKFDACVSWQRSTNEKTAWKDARSFDYLPEEHETFGGCGVDLSSLDLKASFLPRILGGDLDGDGAIDEVAQIQRKSDSKRGIALCRAGTHPTVIGIENGIGTDLPADLVGQIEAWHWITPNGKRPFGYTGIDLPDSDGDILILERIEKQAVTLFWKDGQLRSKELFHIVTE
ncbi:hypothetical protein [Hyphococcus lacteus]|uniref:VCBS repeat-containing protein n=1 Tax=Hyphococcus lacteus TaxID=3143536 RepID=A0ABV3Z2H1_9PROT